MTILYHIFISSCGLAIAFLLYYFLFRNTNDFKQVRLFLITSVLLALLLPFHEVRLDWSEFITTEDTVEIQFQTYQYAYTTFPELTTKQESNIPWKDYLLQIYYVVAGILLIRLLLHAFVLHSVYLISEKQKKDGYVLVINNRFHSHFTFFRWVFVHQDHIDDQNIETILAHERIHVQQLHSLDLMFTEIAAALMWFNPLVWRLKNTVQLIHEYLADEGALSTGIDRFAYQALLINQVAEERFIRLSSNFNHSLIKKRMIMMTKSKNSRSAKVRNLVLLPLAIVLFVAVAGLNSALGQEEKKEEEKEKKVTKTITKKVEIIHLDEDDDDNVFIIKKGGKKGNSFKIIESGDSVKIKKSFSYTITSTHSDDEDDENVYIIKKSKGDKTFEILVDGDNLSSEHFAIQMKDDSEELHFDVNKDIKLKIADDELDNTLLIVDGKEQKNASKLNKIDQEDIETIEVIKGKEAVKKHTKKDVEKVIIIKTKKGKK